MLTECTDTAEAEQQYEESDSDDSDSDNEDEVRNQRQPLAAASHPEASASVDRFRNSEEAKCLAELYMATKEQSPPNSDSQRKQRQAFLSLPRNDWTISRAKKTGKIRCLHASDYDQMWRRRCAAQMPEREK